MESLKVGDIVKIKDREKNDIYIVSFIGFDPHHQSKPLIALIQTDEHAYLIGIDGLRKLSYDNLIFATYINGRTMTTRLEYQDDNMLKPKIIHTGHAICHPCDQFDYTIGETLTKARATFNKKLEAACMEAVHQKSCDYFDMLAQENIAISCPTKKQAELFLRQCENFNMYWGDTTKCVQPKHTKFDIFEQNTCYIIKQQPIKTTLQVHLADSHWCKQHGFQIQTIAESDELTDYEWNQACRKLEETYTKKAFIGQMRRNFEADHAKKTFVERMRDLELLQLQMKRFSDDYGGTHIDWSNTKPKWRLVIEDRQIKCRCETNIREVGVVYFESNVVAEQAKQKFGNAILTLYQ